MRKKQAKHALARKERRRQRSKGGARTVGLAGYTNAGKSSLFLALSGKKVLVEDKLFSTLETTVGRMEMSPRILLVDTIGFIDELPSDLLDAFHATLDESLKCDLLLLVVDSCDEVVEFKRPLTLSFLSYAPNLIEQTTMASSKGHELMLHLPMEPLGDEDPGPGALLVDMKNMDLMT